MAVATKKEEVKKPKPTTRMEIWAKARFSYIEMKEHPGAVWRISPEGERKEFVDGEEYDEPLSFFNMLNDSCREVRRELVKKEGQELGKYLKTNRYSRRIHFDIIKTYEKQVPLTKKEIENL